MSEQPNNTTATSTDRMIDAVSTKMLAIVKHYCDETNGTEADTAKALDCLEGIIASPSDATKLYLEYFADNSKKTEILKEFGSDATFGDLQSL